jgi:hypothetical protein
VIETLDRSMQQCRVKRVVEMKQRSSGIEGGHSEGLRRINTRICLLAVPCRSRRRRQGDLLGRETASVSSCARASRSSPSRLSGNSNSAAPQYTGISPDRPTASIAATRAACLRRRALPIMASYRHHGPRNNPRSPP